jgi:hypothetical protein
MAFFKNLVAMFFSAVLCVCSMHAVGRTESERLNRADVFFKVKRNGEGLALVGKEQGVEKFRVSIEDDSFDTFTEFSDDNFQVKRFGDVLRWRYRSGDEFFQVMVNEDGDITLGNSPRTYAGFDRRKTYAFSTDSVLESYGDYAFYSLVTSANEFHKALD